MNLEERGKRGGGHSKNKLKAIHVFGSIKLTDTFKVNPLLIYERKQRKIIFAA